MAKKVISATIEESLIKWIDEQLKDSHEFRNKSHLIESALEAFKISRKEVKMSGRGPKG
jgi:Arc/MetJ-type ribon-helix-helix transcriptional regulator